VKKVILAIIIFILVFAFTLPIYAYPKEGANPNWDQPGHQGYIISGDAKAFGGRDDIVIFDKGIANGPLGQLYSKSILAFYDVPGHSK